MKWWTISSTSPAFARVSIFGELEPFGGASADTFLAEIGDPQAVELLLDCPGGNSEIGLRLYRFFQERNTTATVTRALSAGLLVMLGARRIRLQPDATLMAHAGHVGVFGTASHLRANAERLDALDKDLVKIVAGRVGMPLAERWFSGADYWIKPDEALALGLVDEVLPVPAPSKYTEEDAKTVALKSGPPMEDREKLDLLLKCIQAIGPMRVNNPAFALRELHVALTRQIRSTSTIEHMPFAPVPGR